MFGVSITEQATALCKRKEWLNDGRNLLWRILKRKVPYALKPMNGSVWKDLSKKRQKMFSLQGAVCRTPSDSIFFQGFTCQRP
jgi:hypothetical protein